MKFRVLLLSFVTIFADESTHTYKEGEEVIAWANKMGPFNNPSETYPYFNSHVPFCSKSVEHAKSHDEFHYSKFDGLGSLLQGNSLVHSGLSIKFGQTESDKILDCTMELDTAKGESLAEAIRNKYWYQMYIDDLPVWGMVGEYLPISKKTGEHHHDNLAHVAEEHFEYDYLSGEKIATYPHVFSHKSFSIAYNDHRIIEVNLTSEDPVLISLSKDAVSQKIKMTYSVTWLSTHKDFSSRFDRYLDFEFFEHQIHWFALFNSFMLVIFLVGMVSMVLIRALKKDFEKGASAAANVDDNDILMYDSMDETGWKRLHGDVFRAPGGVQHFAAVIGTGYQIYACFVLVILLAISGKLYDKRGTIMSTFIATYTLTSIVSGYSSAQVFLDYKGSENANWKVVMVETALLFPTIAFGVMFLLNLLGFSYGSSNRVSFGLFMVILVIFCVSLFLVMAGTILGRRLYKGNDFPTETRSHVMKPLPKQNKWYMNIVVYCLSIGMLPFGSIFIEMYYVFNSFWNYKFYYVFGFMLLVFAILTIVIVCVSIVGTYLLLNTEDYRWKWRSVFAGGTTALYVFLYAIFYFFTKTQMSGLFQFSFYFGYMFLFSLAIFFMCASIAYTGTLLFVKRIYHDLHTA